ncbi:MAG: hypothetical protein LUE98_20120 [Tannerellaceae bacterium]|nr:hypothetical protein [Tannerellaceae bacterium]
MKDIKSRFRFWICFWKSNLGVAVPVGFGLSFLLLPLTLENPDADIFSIISHFLYYTPVGLLFSALYKEISQKGDYYFYYNKGISRIELWISTLLLSYSFWFIFEIVQQIWKSYY